MSEEVSADLAWTMRNTDLVDLLEVRKLAKEMNDAITLRACDDELRRRDKLITDASKLTH